VAKWEFSGILNSTVTTLAVLTATQVGQVAVTMLQIQTCCGLSQLYTCTHLYTPAHTWLSHSADVTAIQPFLKLVIFLSSPFPLLTALQGGVWNIAMGVFVCLSARMCQKPHVQTSRNFLYKLHVAVARSCSGDNTKRYVLQVLWMTTYFHIMDQVWGVRRSESFTVTRQVAPLNCASSGEVCYLPW